jgi:hypothetical protein
MARKAKPAAPKAPQGPWPRDFVVTDMAGPKVNGKRAKAGDIVTFGELEADHELRMGSIEPATTPPAPETE